MDKKKPDQGPRRGDDRESNREWVRTLGIFSVIVTDLVGYTGAGVAVGYFAWKRWNAPWWVVLLSSIAGLVLAMYRVYQVTQKVWK